MKGWVCEDNDICAGRWNVPQRHAIERRLGVGVVARLVSEVRVHVTMVVVMAVVTMIAMVVIVMVMC